MKHRLTAETIKRSHILRRDLTEAKRKVRRLLREKFKDWHFRRQVAIGSYFADFASHAAKLVIELDGGQHSMEVDSARTEFIERHGYRVVRYWNDDALRNSEGIHLMFAGNWEHDPTPNLSPSRGGA